MFTFSTLTHRTFAGFCDRTATVLPLGSSIRNDFSGRDEHAAGPQPVDDDLPVDDHGTVVEEQAATAHRDVEVALRAVRPAEELVRPRREEHVAGEGAQLHSVPALIGG